MTGTTDTTATTTTATPDIGLDPDQLPGAALHELLARFRAAPGLGEVRFHGMPAYVISRFDDLHAFLADDETFPGGTTYQQSTAPVVGDTFISMDGPQHDAYRQLAMPAFRSRAVARFVDHDLVPLAHEVVDRFASRGRADLVAEVARVLPFWAICRKVGLPMGSEEEYRRLALAQLRLAVEPEAALGAAATISEMVTPLIEARRAEPTDDVLTHLVHAERNGQRFTDEEIVSHVRLLFSVGATTTSDAMSNLFAALAQHPDVLARAQADPGTHPAIVQELLRWEPPVSLLPRIVVAGGRVAGQDVAPGTMLLCGIAGANRDETQFDDADAFDPWRPPHEILTFGFGSKYCPGTHLARQQLVAALGVVLERLPDLRFVESAEPSGAILRSTPSVVAEWTSV